MHGWESLWLQTSCVGTNKPQQGCMSFPLDPFFWTPFVRPHFWDLTVLESIVHLHSLPTMLFHSLAIEVCNPEADTGVPQPMHQRRLAGKLTAQPFPISVQA